MKNQCQDCGAVEVEETLDDPTLPCGYCAGDAIVECDAWQVHQVAPMYSGIHPECDRAVQDYLDCQQRDDVA